jgi:hypothetical protein
VLEKYEFEARELRRFVVDTIMYRVSDNLEAVLECDKLQITIDDVVDIYFKPGVIRLSTHANTEAFDILTYLIDYGADYDKCKEVLVRHNELWRTRFSD